jgi:integrase/recombinase XerD
LTEYLTQAQTEVEPYTLKGYIMKLAPFRERLGMRPLASLTEEDGLAYKAYLMRDHEWEMGGYIGQDGKRVGGRTGKGLAPVTVNNHLRNAKIFLNWAAKPKRGYIPRNPWTDIKSLPQKPRQRLVTPEEATHLYEQARGRDLKDRLMLFFNSTARPQEVRVLDWHMVDWDHHQIRIPADRTKTRQPRTITLLPEVEAMLRDRRARTGGSGLIFPSQQGGVVSAGGLSGQWRKLVNKCVRLGLIEAEKLGERLVPYSARHTTCVRLLNLGVNLKAVSLEMGHANVQTTSQHYAHLSSQDVTNTVLAAFAKPVAGDKTGRAAG